MAASAGIEFFCQRTTGVHGIRQAAVEVGCAAHHPTIGNVAGQAVQFPRGLKNHASCGGVTNIEAAGSIFLMKIERIENARAADLRCFIGIEIHCMRVGVASAQSECTPVARDPQYGSFVGGICAAEDLTYLLVIGIESTGESGWRGSGWPGGEEWDRDLRGLDWA